jgi:hypothetical protein
LAGYQTCGNLPTIQILITIDYTLRQFYKKVKRQQTEISELADVTNFFGTRCPLCGEADCARFLGYYYRQVIDQKGRYYPDFPVPRFRCHRKGKEKLPTVNHKTFSLLHYHLIPYTIYSLPFIVKILNARHIDKKTVEYIQRYLAEITTTGDDYKELSASGIITFKGLLINAVTKILASGYYSLLSRKMKQAHREIDRIIIFLDFCQDFTCQKYFPPIRGPCALSYDFYITGGSYFRNAFFLFGTPSQFRRINYRR